MPASLQIKGLEELQAALARLPGELREETAPRVEAAAKDAEDAIRAAYPERTGALKAGLRHGVQSTAGGTRAWLVNIATHAAIWEYGTEIRHTDLGQHRGRMPAGKVFVPAVVRERREMKSDLIRIVEEAGFKVHGD
jgi:hypothetical protein